MPELSDWAEFCIRGFPFTMSGGKSTYPLCSSDEDGIPLDRKSTFTLISCMNLLFDICYMTTEGTFTLA